MTQNPHNGSDTIPTISCAEFQEQFPNLFASGENGAPQNPVLTAHLHSCDNCAALLRDLQYIADQASLLLTPTHEPSEAVWDKIRKGMDTSESAPVSRTV